MGSFAYDVGAIGQAFSACACENGLGGILRVDGTILSQENRYGVHFDSCILQGGVVVGAINDTGKMSVVDFGVDAMILINVANVIFTNTSFLSEILRPPTTTVLGAKLINSCDVIINQSGDKAIN